MMNYVSLNFSEKMIGYSVIVNSHVFEVRKLTIFVVLNIQSYKSFSIILTGAMKNSKIVITPLRHFFFNEGATWKKNAQKP